VKRPFRLGLTGGIGSGKSTVANLLVQQGAGLIDADAISRATTAAHGAAIPLLRAHFGEDFVDETGAMHRERMRQHVFANPQAKKALEAIIHPLVGQGIAEQARHLADDGKVCIVFDIPLLVESGHWRAKFDRVLVVDCNPATQVQRVALRSGLAAPEVEKIIAAQAPRLLRLAAADLVVCNDGISMRELAAQVHPIGQQFGL
jgi:dephospho-CoA kinase